MPLGAEYRRSKPRWHWVRWGLGTQLPPHGKGYSSLPTFRTVYCGQTVAHLSSCWALVRNCHCHCGILTLWCVDGCQRWCAEASALFKSCSREHCRRWHSWRRCATWPEMEHAANAGVMAIFSLSNQIWSYDNPPFWWGHGKRLCKKIAKHVIWTRRMLWIVVDGRSW